MLDGFKLRRTPRRPKDDTHGAIKHEGAPGSSKRPRVNFANCHGRVVFKDKQNVSRRLRNSEGFHIEWDNISVNTWEPAKHLDLEDGRAAITTWELQAVR